VELREEAGLATKLEDEASACKRRLARPKFLMSSVEARPAVEAVVSRP
jgi:hypothetical protein